MDGNLWDVPAGAHADFKVQICDEADDPIAYAGYEALTVVVWQGDDMAPVPGLLSASWTGGDSLTGVCVVTIDGAATAALASDYYLVRLTVTTSMREYLAYEGWLRLGDAPGSAVAPAMYCSLQDLIDVAGDWIVGLMTSTGRTSFIADRARASRKLEEVVLSRSRPLILGDCGGWSLLNYNAWMSPEAPDQYLAGLLATGRLVVTPDVKEAVAYLAASLVCERALTWDENDVHAKRAGAYYKRWRLRLNTLNVGVDYSTAGDGSSIRYFAMSTFSQR